MEIENKFIKKIGDNLTAKTSHNIEFVYPNLYKLLNISKNKIDEKNEDWDRMKKITNPYELIHISNCRDKKNNSIAKYIPLSRSYFKMWEMLIDYNLFENINDTIYTASLAEGPGGFMEAIYNYRKKYFNREDKIYGITLQSENKYIPGWKKIANNNFNFNICYGNLYNLFDILKFSENFKDKKAYLITADGGFDYSIDFNNQEQLSLRIIFCEIVTALGIQKIGGIFICKIFDIFTLFTLKLIYLLYCFYDNIFITKPKTSRSANSEKYIIAKGFKGIKYSNLQQLYKIIDTWDILTKNGMCISDINDIDVDNRFIKLLYNYNYNYILNQLKYIDKTIDYVYKKPDKELYKKHTKEQITNALLWCKKYNIKINKDSRYVHQ